MITYHWLKTICPFFESHPNKEKSNHSMTSEVPSHYNDDILIRKQFTPNFPKWHPFTFQRPHIPDIRKILQVHLCNLHVTIPLN